MISLMSVSISLDDIYPKVAFNFFPKMYVLLFSFDIKQSIFSENLSQATWLSCRANVRLKATEGIATFY